MLLHFHNKHIIKMSGHLALTFWISLVNKDMGIGESV